MKTCHDCGVKPGKFHKPGCDWERCPFCYGQMITCNCVYKFFGIYKDLEKNYPKVYEDGISDEMAQIWDWVLHKKGLLPYKTNKLEKEVDNAPEGKINQVYAKQIRNHHNDIEEFRNKLFKV